MATEGTNGTLPKNVKDLIADGQNVLNTKHTGGNLHVGYIHGSPVFVDSQPSACNRDGSVGCFSVS